MAYIIQRKNRFYVVAYDGLDPLSGKERRRWHPAGHDRHEAEQMAARIQADAAGATSRSVACGPTTSTTSTTNSPRPAAVTEPVSPPRPCTRST